MIPNYIVNNFYDSFYYSNMSKQAARPERIKRSSTIKENLVNLLDHAADERQRVRAFEINLVPALRLLCHLVAQFAAHRAERVVLVRASRRSARVGGDARSEREKRERETPETGEHAERGASLSLSLSLSEETSLPSLCVYSVLVLQPLVENAELREETLFPPQKRARARARVYGQKKKKEKEARERKTVQSQGAGTPSRRGGAGVS